MKPREKLFISFLSVLLTVLCLAIEHKSQIRPPGSGTGPDTSAAQKADLSNWQTVLWSGRGIKYKLPPDWNRKKGEEVVGVKNYEESAWASPDEELNGHEGLSIRTFPGGFWLGAWKGTYVSKEQMLEEEFKRVAQGPALANDPETQTKTVRLEAKRLKLNGVEGVFSIDAEDNGGFKHLDLVWTCFRTYQRKKQQVRMVIWANPNSRELLNTILSTLEIEQDKDAKP